MASTVAARRPSFEKKRSTSSVNLVNNDDETHGPVQHTRQHKKHFVVHAGRHHSRVPSYGRNLNKLSKTNLAHEGAAAAKGHHLERGGSNGRSKTRLAAATGAGTGAGTATTNGEAGRAEDRRSAAAAGKAKPVFDLGDSEEDTANEDEEEVVEVIEEPRKSPVKRTAGLKKSSSTKSMERQRSDQGSSRRLNGVERDHSQMDIRIKEPQTLQLKRNDPSKQQAQAQRQQTQQEQLQQQQQLQQYQQQQHLKQQQQLQLQLQQQQQQQQQQQLQQQQQKQQKQQQQNTGQKAQKNQQTVTQVGSTIGSKGSSSITDIAHDSGVKASRLFAQVGHTAAAPPQLNVDNATGVHVVATASSSGGNGSYPNSNALQSRFIDSPGRSGVSTSTSPGYSLSEARATAKSRPESIKSLPDNSVPVSSPPFTQTNVKPALGGGGSSTSIGPSRTQQKLWLQRQQDEDVLPPKRSARPDSWAGIAQKEMERVAREFMNVRRFKNPTSEGIDRIRDHPKLQRRIPRNRANGTIQEMGMGLSRSLNTDLGRAARAQIKTPRASQDDSGLRDSSPERDPVVHAKLMQLWNQAHLLPSNE